MPQWSQLVQETLRCEFRRRIRNPRAKEPPSDGNVLSWPATAADHAIVSFSAVSARNGLKMCPFALYAHTDGGSDREDGLRNMKCTCGGQQQRSIASAAVLSNEHQHVKRRTITATGAHSCSAGWAAQANPVGACDRCSMAVGMHHYPRHCERRGARLRPKETKTSETPVGNTGD